MIALQQIALNLHIKTSVVSLIYQTAKGSIEIAMECFRLDELDEHLSNLTAWNALDS